jgi:fucose permease
MENRARLGLGIALLAFLAYVSLGLPDGLLGVAWPSIRHDFSLPLDSLGALFIATTAGYLSSSFFAGRLMARFRLGTLLALSTLFAGAALVGYAVSPGWWVMVGIGVAAGLGGGGIDAALNIYVAAHHGEAMMQWLHASYGVGAMLGPVVMTLAISAIGSWRWGYVIVGGLQLALAACFVLTASRWDGKTGPARGARAQGTGAAGAGRGSDTGAAGAGTGRGAGPGGEEHRRHADVPMMETLREWRVWLSMFLFFVYMGIEVALGSWAYTLLTESRGVSPRAAGFFMASYWGIFTVGRIVAGFYTRRVSQRTIVLSSLLVALLGAVLLALDIPGIINLVACAIIGLAIAPVLAALLSGTSGRVGARHTPNSIGIQIAAMGAGGAAVPSLTGVVAERFSLQAIPPFLIALTVVLIGAYLFSLRRGREAVGGEGAGLI